MLTCPKCSRIIMDKTENGGFKVRSRMLLFDEFGRAQAICPTCKAKMYVPIIINDRAVKEYKTLPKQKIIINS